MIELKNINRQFKVSGKQFNHVLKDISLKFPEKGLCAIYGKSGSGKTTLLNILGGLDRPNSGKIIIDGEECSYISDKVRNKEIGFIFQNYYLERDTTIHQVLENQMRIAGFTDKHEMKRRSEKVLDLVKLSRFKNKTTDSLSGGQKQRVAIARALVKGADIILADEPTGNLDSENTTAVMEILKEISKTKLVILVTHEQNLIQEYSDAHIELVDGSVTFSNVESGEHKTGHENSNIVFEKSVGGKTGRLFSLKNIVKTQRATREERAYSTANIFKQIFLIAFAVVLSFLSMKLFEYSKADVLRKNIKSNQTLVRLNDYHFIRELEDGTDPRNPVKEYDDIDYFSAEDKSGVFSLNGISRAGSAEVTYTQKTAKNLKDGDILVGRLPEAGEIVISKGLAEKIRKQYRLKTFTTLKTVEMLQLDGRYKIVGVVPGQESNIYFNQEDYINSLGIFSGTELYDPTEMYFPSSFKFSNITTRISLTTVDNLKKDEAILEVSSAAQRKIGSLKSLADVNAELLGQPKSIQLKNSKVFIKEIRRTEENEYDFNIKVGRDTLNDIFHDVAPNLGRLKNTAGIDNLFYLITNNNKEKQNVLRTSMDEKNLIKPNLKEYYDLKKAELKSNLAPAILITFAGVLLLFLIYYFIEKAESIKNRKEYGILRAIGVGEGNLLFKETMGCVLNNFISFTIFLTIGFIFILARYLILNVVAGYFALIVFAIYVATLAIFLLISLSPYLFVVKDTPAKILSRYDI